MHFIRVGGALRTPDLFFDDLGSGRNFFDAMEPLARISTT